MEKFRTLAETTLSAGYTAGSFTVVVVSAAAFPATGVFRIRLGNTGRTVFRVDSVAGTTFTGVAEVNDANGTIGDSVTLVNTAGAMQQMLQVPAVSEGRALAGLDGALSGGPIYRLTPLDQSAWSWANQGSFTAVQAGGIVFLTGTLTGGAGANLGVRFTTAPVAPYIITAALIPIFGGDDGATTPINSTFGGIGFRDSGTTELEVILIAGNGGIYIRDYNSPTSLNATQVTRVPACWGFPVWLQIEDNNTDVIFRYSTDGVNFTLLFSQPRTTFLTPDQICIFASNEGVFDGRAGASFISFLET